MTTINVNPTPKAKFLENQQHVKEHMDLIVRPDFQRAIDVALLQMQAEQVLRFNGQQYESVASFHRIEGAMQFVQTLRLIGMQAKTPHIVDRDNLQPQ